MKKIMLIPIVMMITACGNPPKKLPPAPPAPVPVVVCDVTVKRASTSLDSAQPGQPLEKQNTVLRKTIAQLKSYSIELEAGLIECGGKIN